MLFILEDFVFLQKNQYKVYFYISEKLISGKDLFNQFNAIAALAIKVNSTYHYMLVHRTISQTQQMFTLLDALFMFKKADESNILFFFSPEKEFFYSALIAINGGLPPKETTLWHICSNDLNIALAQVWKAHASQCYEPLNQTLTFNDISAIVNYFDSSQ